MNPRQLAKTGMRYARQTTAGFLSLPRALPAVRRRLRLPVNGPCSVDRLAGRADVLIHSLDTEIDFERPLPAVPYAPGALAFFQERRREAGHAPFVAELAGGRAWGTSMGAVFTVDGHFIPAFSRDPWGPRLHRVWLRWRLPEIRRLPGRTLYLVTPEAGANYHHWMIDLLPRLGLVRRAGYDLGQFSHIIVNHQELAFQKETLAKLGLAEARLIVADERLHVQAERLVVPSLKSSNQSLPAADLEFLRSLFPPATTPPRRRLYLSRRDARFRRLSNEAELWPLWQAHGFEDVPLAPLSVVEQAGLFSQAAAIAGPAGAAFANSVFAPATCHVIEITPPHWLSVYHWMISARLDRRHSILLGEGSVHTGAARIEDRTRDFSLSPDRLRAFLSAHFPR